MRVWILSTSPIKMAGLVRLVCSFGFDAVNDPRPAVEVAVWDLLDRTPQDFPAPTAVPTLALVPWPESQCLRLLLNGYRGYLRSNDSGGILRRAIVALSQDEMWASRRALASAFSVLVPPRPDNPGPAFLTRGY